MVGREGGVVADSALFCLVVFPVSRGFRVFRWGGGDMRGRIIRFVLAVRALKTVLAAWKDQ